MKKRINAREASRGPSKRAKTSMSAMSRKIPLYKPTQAALGEVQRVKMIYTDIAKFNTSVGGLQSFIYCANGLFDPDISGVGHQPSGFDQYKLIYSRYTVTNARIRVSLRPEASTGRTGGTFGITFCGGDSAAAGDYREYIENGECVWKSIGANNTQPVDIVYNLDLGKALGMKILDRAEFDGTDTANPLASQFFHLWLYVDNAGDTGDLPYTVEIAYDVVWRRNNLLELS